MHVLVCVPFSCESAYCQLIADPVIQAQRNWIKVVPSPKDLRIMAELKGWLLCPPTSRCNPGAVKEANGLQNDPFAVRDSGLGQVRGEPGSHPLRYSVLYAN